MFQHLSGTQVLRDPAVLTTTINVDFEPFDTRSGTIVIVLLVAGRSTGNVTPSLRGSFDDGDTYVTLKTYAAISADGTTYLEFAGPLPAKLRLHLAYAAAFDGTLGAKLRSAGLTGSETE